jgi:hypothetical protein
MYQIIVVLIALIFLIIFYKWCYNRKMLFYKVLLFVGILPFICNFIYSIISTKNGFNFDDFPTVYGLEAFSTCFWIDMVFFFPIFISAGIAIIISIINLIKLKRGSNEK